MRISTLIDYFVCDVSPTTPATSAGTTTTDRSGQLANAKHRLNLDTWRLADRGQVGVDAGITIQAPLSVALLSGTTAQARPSPKSGRPFAHDYVLGLRGDPELITILPVPGQPGRA